MISVVIPTLNAAEGLAATLGALVPAAVDGFVREVIVVDGGSADTTVAVAEDAGARVLDAERGRGRQLAAGCAAARGPWLLALHADTRLDAGWEAVAHRHMADRAEAAAFFRFTLDDPRPVARVWETGVRWMTQASRMPYGDQGLLISKALYSAVGGYPDWPLMEDVAIARALGRRRLLALPARAVTSAARFRRDGYLRRSVGNAMLMARFLAGADPEQLARDYG